MKKSIFFLIFIIIFIAGCSQVDLGKINLSEISEDDINKVIVCNKPYMRYAAECCLDKNDNSICDKDEIFEIETDDIKLNNNSINIDIDFSEYLSITELGENNLISLKEGKTTHKMIESGIQVSKEIFIKNNHDVSLLPGQIDIKINGDQNKVILQDVIIYDNYGNKVSKVNFNHLTITPSIFEPLLPNIERKYQLEYKIIKNNKNSNNIDIGKQSQERLTTSLEVVQITGTDTSDSMINAGTDNYVILVRLGSGSTPIKLEDLIITIDTDLGSQTQIYKNNKISSTTFNVTYISNSGIPQNGGYLVTGDLVQFNVLSNFNIGEGQQATITLLSKNGALQPIKIRTPNSMIRTVTKLYP